MDDLSGLDWSSTNKPSTSKPTLAAQSAAFGSYASYTSLHPTPPPQTLAGSGGSGRTTPLSLSNQGSGTVRNNASATNAVSNAQDSFSGLVNFGNSSAKTANLSLREQQERLNAEKRRKEEEQRKLNQANYGNGQFFDILGRGPGPSSPSYGASLAPPGVAGPVSRGSSPLGESRSGGDDDLFAAFSADTKVDKSSHFPPPAANDSGKSTPANAPLDLSSPGAWGAAATKPTPLPPSSLSNNANDDDPFGLNQFQSRAAPTAASADAAFKNTADDDDDVDFLGDLAKPVDQVRRQMEAQEQEKRRQQQQQQQRRRRRPETEPEPGKPIEGPDSDSDSDSESDTGPRAGRGTSAKTSSPQFDRAVAELVDYGFSAEDARRGLAESGPGLNVQAAVNFLLDDAHKRAKEKQKSGRGEGRPPSAAAAGSSHPGGDDFAKTAAAVGTSLFKTANSLWKTGQKQLQKAVQDFQQDGDPSQPKWMRSAQEPTMDTRRSNTSATDEAMMLEPDARPERPERRHAQAAPAPTSSPAERFRNNSQPPSRTQSPAAGSVPVPRWQTASDPRARLTKQAIEEESAQVYVSPARRRKAQTPSASAASTPPPAPAPAPEPKPAFDSAFEGDLLSNSTALPPRRPAQQPTPPTRSAPRSSGPAMRPAASAAAAAAARKVPPVNSFVLKASAKHRADGAVHFKRGDYAAAHASYSASLTDIPNSHPLLAVLYCNRALTALKTGEPRQAVVDADSALSIIGPGRGEGEAVDLEDGTGTTRDLKDIYGKALMRKAEALEQMEKWAEAGEMWQLCVEGGVGGATAIAGRQRCQTAVKPKPKSAAVRPRPTAAAKAVAQQPSALSALSGTATPVSATGRDFEAVKRLREANAAAAREDSEKMALVDAVDARVAAWRDGKRDNIRALLGSMDKVLWEGSGWKPVGLHELVMPNKVKIHYMKAIAKTHPDKIAPDASTEVRMIAGSVFSTLNESWDKFKADNKM